MGEKCKNLVELAEIESPRERKKRGADDRLNVEQMWFYTILLSLCLSVHIWLCLSHTGHDLNVIKTTIIGKKDTVHLIHFHSFLCMNSDFLDFLILGIKFVFLSFSLFTFSLQQKLFPKTHILYLAFAEKLSANIFSLLPISICKRYEKKYIFSSTSRVVAVQKENEI